MRHEFSRYFRKIQTSNFMKIRPVGSELFHADGRTGTPDESNRRYPQILLTRPKRIELQSYARICLHCMQQWQLYLSPVNPKMSVVWLSPSLKLHDSLKEGHYRSPSPPYLFNNKPTFDVPCIQLHIKQINSRKHIPSGGRTPLKSNAGHVQQYS